MKLRILMAVSLLALVGTACSQEQKTTATEEATPAPEVEVIVEDIPSEITGNVLALHVRATGVEIAAPAGNSSAQSAHFVVFVDREPVGVGEPIPNEKGVIESAEQPIKVWGLTEGKHTLKVALADGSRRRIHEKAVASKTVTVTGPWVQASAPSEVKAGEELTITIKSSGFTVVDPEASHDMPAMGEKVGHYHILYDGAEPKGGQSFTQKHSNGKQADHQDMARFDVAAGEPMAQESMEMGMTAGRIFHTSAGMVTLTNIPPGEHTIYVVVGTLEHRAFDPLVADKLTVRVKPA